MSRLLVRVPGQCLNDLVHSLPCHSSASGKVIAENGEGQPFPALCVQETAECHNVAECSSLCQNPLKRRLSSKPVTQCSIGPGNGQCGEEVREMVLRRHV